MPNWGKFDETVSSDLFSGMLERIEDKIAEQGSLSSLVGNETSFSLSISREESTIFANINLFPEGDLSLNADEFDQIGDFVAEKLKGGLINGAIKAAGIAEGTYSISGNVLVDGERPLVGQLDTRI